MEGALIRILTGFLVCGGLLWGASNNVEDIGIVVKKNPCAGCALITATSDGNGRLYFDVTDPGEYTIEASQNVATGTPVDLTLRGIFTSIGTAPAGALVTGTNLNGASLIAAMTPSSPEVLIQVNSPVHFVGQFFADPVVTASTNHLTFYAVANGAAPLPQTLYILNNSTSSVTYAAAAQTLGSPWTVNLSPASGSVNAGASGGIAVQPAVSAQAGTYSALLNISEQTGGATTQQAVGITLVVRAPGATDATIGVNPVMAVSYSQTNGTLTPAVFTVTNQDATVQTYGITFDQAAVTPTTLVSVQPAQFTLASGASQTVTVQGNFMNSLPLTITASSGAVTQVWDVPLSVTGPTETCTPTQLLPVVNTIDPVAREGSPLNVSLQAYDNCGNSYPEFTTSVSIGNGTVTDLLAAAPSTGRAVFSGSLTFVDIAPPCCSFIPAGPAGTTLTISVDAANPLGGNDLMGSVEIPVNYESDPTAPILSVGGLVSAASFQPVAVSPLEIFSAFGVFPGLATASAQGAPWPTSLNNLQILFDGEAAPLYFTSLNQVNGVVPGDLPPGEHQVTAFYNGILSGSMTIMMGDANPAAFTSDGTTVIAVKTNGSIVSPANPANVGDILVMYVDGLGLSTVPVQTGFPSPSELLPAALPVTLTIDGAPQSIAYAGFTPGAISLFQINFTVGSTPAPAAGSSGPVSLPIQITAGANIGPLSAMGTFNSNSTLSIATISVVADFPDAQFNVNSQLITGSTGILTFNAGSQISLNVPPDPQTPSTGVQYAFTGWSQGGNRAQTLTAPAGASSYTANFAASYLLTINGTATVSPSGSGGYYPAGTNVTVTGACPGGGVPRGLLVADATDSITNFGGSISVPMSTALAMYAPLAVTVQCSAPPPLLACVLPPLGMISWYSLDEVASPSKDIAPGVAGANAMWVGNPTPVAGEVAGALSFNGSSQWVQAVNASEGDIGTGDMSIDAWVKTTNSTGFQQIVNKMDSSGTGYFLAVLDGYLHFEYTGGWEWTDQASGNGGPTFLADGKWHHVAVTIARTSLTGGSAFYVDGVPILLLDTKNQPASWSNTQPLSIGGGGPYPGLAFNGAIDEVEIFNRALAATEIEGIYAAGSFGNCKPVTDMVTTNPPNLNVTIDGGAQLAAPQTLNWASGGSHTLGAPTPQLDTAGDTQYTLSTTTPWSASAGASITSAGVVASAPASSSIFTANFNTAYKVTLVLNGGCVAGQTSPANLSASNPVFVAANSTVQVIISAAASLPNTFQNFAVTPATNATLGSGTVTINPLTGPVTITANCAPPPNSTVSYNLATNFGSSSTCTGVGDDKPALVAFNAAALTWQQTHTGLITLTIPQQGTISKITNATFGSGATATAAVSGGSLVITVTAGGSGYNAATVSASLSGGTGSGGTIGKITVSGGAVTAIPFSGGSWTVAPTVTISSGVLVTTAAPHGWSTGQWVTATLPGVNVVNNSNVVTAEITAIDSSDFTISTAVTGAYTSGGQASSSVCMFPDGDGANFHPFANGLRQVKVTTMDGTQATGITFTDAGSGGGTVSMGAIGTSSLGPWTGGFYSARVQTVAAGSNSVTLVTPSNTSIFSAGTYALMAGIDLEGYGYPINPAIFEYVYITGVNSATGVVTFSAPLQHAYESTWPLYDSGSHFQNDEGGPATLFWIDPSWNVQIEYDGLTISQAGQTYSNGYSILYNNVTFTGGNCGIPTQNYSWVVQNSNMTGCDMEVDKLINTVVMENVTIHQILFQSASVDTFTLDNSTVTNTVNGSPITFMCSNSTLARFGPGAYAYGASNSASLDNCSVALWESYGTGASSADFTMANGIITWPNSNGVPAWAAPGNVLYWTGDVKIAGYPFTITDLTQDATNTYIATTLGGGVPPVPPYHGSPLSIANFPVKQFTCNTCTGSATSLDLAQSAPETRLWSYTDRTFTPNAATTDSSPYGGGTIWGSLVSMTIDVVTPYTGVDSTLSLDALAEFHFPALQLSNNAEVYYDPIVNLKIAGKRVITPLGVTGAQSGDSGLSVGGQVWLYGTYASFLSSTISSESSSVWPMVNITIQTNQN